MSRSHAGFGLTAKSTSIRLERAFWVIMDELAETQGMTTPGFMSKLHSEVLELHGEPKNFGVAAALLLPGSP